MTPHGDLTMNNDTPTDARSDVHTLGELIDRSANLEYRAVTSFER